MKGGMGDFEYYGGELEIKCPACKKGTIRFDCPYDIGNFSGECDNCDKEVYAHIKIDIDGVHYHEDEE